MKASDFAENENAINDHASKDDVALDWEPAYAAVVGSIVSSFALIEDYAPQILALLTGCSGQDARSIMGTFRAFSNRLDLLKSIYKTRGQNSTDAIIGTHYVSLLIEANKIRNKYAHSTYATTNKSIIIKTFSSDYNRGPETFEMGLGDFKRDRDRLRRITAELHGLVYRREIPKSLHRQLQKQCPQP
jgi:hypothetical protein